MEAEIIEAINTVTISNTDLALLFIAIFILGFCAGGFISIINIESKFDKCFSGKQERG